VTTNQELLRQLYLMAQLLELEGANPFRIRAYERAAQTLSGLTQKITIFFHQFPAQLYGIDIPSLVSAILQAYHA